MNIEDFVARGAAAQEAADEQIAHQKKETLSPLAEALKRRYFQYAGNQHIGAHLPETWNEVAKEALRQDSGLVWLAKELRTAQQFLIDAKSAGPRKNVNPTLAREYLRGLRDMLDWVIQKCECEAAWQELRRFLGDYAQHLPDHGSEIVFSKKGEKS